MTRDFVWKYEEQISLTIKSLPISRILADAIILPEDRNLIMSPDSSVDPAELASPEQIAREIASFQPRRLGEVLISSGEKFNTKLLFNAVVYDFDQVPCVTTEIVTRTLKECLLQCRSNDITRVVLPPIGVEHRGIPLRSFVRCLIKSITFSVKCSTCPEELVVAAKDDSQKKDLEKWIKILSKIRLVL